MRAYFEHRTAASAAAFDSTEAGIEKTGKVHAKLADKGVVGQHFGGMVGRHDDCFARGQNVEIVGVENDPARLSWPAMSIDRLPEIARVVVVDPIDIDQIGVAACLVADDTASLIAGDIDSEGETVADRLARG